MKTFTQFSLTGILIFYLTFSFILWDLNPSRWEKGTRATLVFIWFGWVAISAIIVSTLEDLKNKDYGK
jgi:hypothetical protein